MQSNVDMTDDIFSQNWTQYKTIIQNYGPELQKK